MSVDEVMEQVREVEPARRWHRGRVTLVELTGGEPLLQEEIYPLAEQLAGGGLYGDDRNQRRAICRAPADAR